MEEYRKAELAYEQAENDLSAAFSAVEAAKRKRLTAFDHLVASMAVLPAKEKEAAEAKYFGAAH